MKTDITQLIKVNETEILDIWIEKMKESSDDRAVNIISDQAFIETSKQFIELVVSSVVDSKDKFNVKVSKYIHKIVSAGWPLTFVTTGLRTLQKLVYERMKNEYDFTAEQLIVLTEDLDNWMDPIYDKLVDVFSATGERTISLQKIALQELSAPLIPVFDKISIMPLVGTVDTERARLIMENLLNGVVNHRAEVVLIDITGVPVVDTMVAHHIIQASEAVRLVGAKCMIVGIRPEIAQTIVTLGIDLSQIITTNTMQKGIETALGFTNRKIVQVEGSD